MTNSPEVVVCADPSDVALQAARRIHQCIDEVVEAKGFASIALSGGSTPRETLAVLATRDVDWSNVLITQVDERLVSDNDRARNLTMLREALLDRINPAAICAMPPLPPGGDADEALEAHRLALADAVGAPAAIDIAVLGLGDDGHTASLVPGDPVLGETTDVGLTNLYNGTRRLTLTVPALRSASHQLMIVTGNAKADAVERLRGRGNDPAHLIVGRNTVVLVDRAAAGATEPQIDV